MVKNFFPGKTYAYSRLKGNLLKTLKLKKNSDKCHV